MRMHIHALLNDGDFVVVRTLECTYTNLYSIDLMFAIPKCLEYIKGNAVPLQAWSGPEGSRKLWFPGCMTTAQDGGKVVSPTHRPPLPPRKCSSYSFLLGAESTPGL